MSKDFDKIMDFYDKYKDIIDSFDKDIESLSKCIESGDQLYDESCEYIEQDELEKSLELLKKAKNFYRTGINKSSNILNFLDKLNKNSDLNKSIDELVKDPYYNYLIKLQACFSFLPKNDSIENLQDKANDKLSEIDDILNKFRY